MIDLAVEEVALHRAQPQFHKQGALGAVETDLQEAVRWLRRTDKSIKTIAYSLGFSDPKSFTRWFKQHFEVKPSDLRLAPPSGLVDPPEANKKVFPMNVHLLPPQTTPLCLERYLPKGKPAEPVRSERESILDEITHPEKYV